ncbi:MAG: hypothetical protein A3E80_04315 [Chlamydiae bacterium RIFCSPHIGHO2_12_FULL_49_9]|nr:MAG: hypothetical protein A3E80_04315 [Chlamydiae bacterium RIFCSPHIGHO2_12_FULL_49_9]
MTLGKSLSFQQQYKSLARQKICLSRKTPARGPAPPIIPIGLGIIKILKNNLQTKPFAGSEWDKELKS